MIKCNVPVVHTQCPWFGLSYGQLIPSHYAVKGETVQSVLSFDSTFYKVNVDTLTVTSFTLPVFCVVSSSRRVFWFRRYNGRVIISLNKPTSFCEVPEVEDCNV